MSLHPEHPRFAYPTAQPTPAPVPQVTFSPWLAALQLAAIQAELHNFAGIAEAFRAILAKERAP